MSGPKYCTHCGLLLKDALEVYDEELFSRSGILRLRECAACGREADSHAEWHGSAVAIDLLMQKPQAYRHVLLNNGGFYSKIVLRLTLLAVICDGYISWADLPTAGEFFEQEMLFYEQCAKIVLALTAFAGIALLVPGGGGYDLRAKFQGLLMAYSLRLTNVAAFLWRNKAGEGELLAWLRLFCYSLFALPTVRILQVTQNRCLSAAFVICLVSHLGFALVINLDRILDSAAHFYCA